MADRLKLDREMMGYISQSDFALRNKIQTTTYQRHESGVRNILTTSIINYCKILNISIVWLMTGSKKHESNKFELSEKIEYHLTWSFNICKSMLEIMNFKY